MSDHFTRLLVRYFHWLSRKPWIFFSEKSSENDVLMSMVLIVSVALEWNERDNRSADECLVVIMDIYGSRVASSNCASTQTLFVHQAKEYGCKPTSKSPDTTRYNLTATHAVNETMRTVVTSNREVHRKLESHWTKYMPSFGVCLISYTKSQFVKFPESKPASETLWECLCLLLGSLVCC